MEIPFLSWLLQGIPESISSAALILDLCTGGFLWKKVLLIGSLQAVTLYFIRLMPLIPGVHTLIGLVTMNLYLFWLAGTNLVYSAIASGVVLVILILSEFLSMFLAVKFGYDSLAQVLSDLKGRVLFGYPQIVLMIIFSYIAYKKKFSLQKKSARIENN